MRTTVASTTGSDALASASTIIRIDDMSLNLTSGLTLVHRLPLFETKTIFTR